MSEYQAVKTNAGKGKVIDRHGFSVCACSGGSYEDTVKRAEQIAIALNNHERLVEALRDCLSGECDLNDIHNARALLAELDAGE